MKLKHINISLLMNSLKHTNTIQKFLYFWVVLFLVSCEGQQSKEEQSKLIISADEAEFNFKIEESSLKLNPENELQCANYFFSESNSKTGFEIYAGQLQDIISELMNIDKTDISIETNTTYGKFFNIEYKGKINIKKNELILNKLFKYYGVEIMPTQRKVNVFVLNITDSTKLKPNKNNASEAISSEFKMVDNELIFKNVLLNTLTTQLEIFSKERFEYEEKNKNRYDLKIKINRSLEEILNFIDKEYGIGTDRKTKVVTIYKVVDKI